MISDKGNAVKEEKRMSAKMFGLPLSPFKFISLSVTQRLSSCFELGLQAILPINNYEQFKICGDKNAF